MISLVTWAMTRTVARTLQVILLAAAVLAGCSGAPSTAPGSPGSTGLSASGTPTGATPTPTRTDALPTVAPTPFPLFGPLPMKRLDAGRADALQDVLDGMVAAGAPDAIAAVVTPEGTWTGASGVGGPDGRAATVEDEFAIASVTKIFTAALVLRLAEQGRIDLDAKLSTYLDGVHDANGATVREVLGMRSGMADFGPEAADEIAADPAHAWTRAELVARFPDAVGPPGSGYQQASPNYILLALAIEQVTAGPFADALRSEVLDPVGADRILEQGADVDTPMPWALPTEAHRGRFEIEDLGAGGAISCISSATYGPGSGSIASDAASLAAWSWHLFAGDIVSEASLAAMLPASDGHGLGIERVHDVGRPAVGQTGGKTGYGTILAVAPAEQTVVVLLVNDPDFIVEPYVIQLTEASRKG